MHSTIVVSLVVYVREHSSECMQEKIVVCVGQV